MHRTIETWRFKSLPSQEEYDTAIETMKRQLMDKHRLSSLEGYRFLKVENMTYRVIHAWIVPDETKEDA